MADTANPPELPLTVTARLARVSAAVRHCPVADLLHRVPLALAAHGLAVVSTRVAHAQPEGVRRPGVEVQLTVRDLAELHPATTFTCLADITPFDAPSHPIGSAVLDATQLLWIVAFGVDVAHPVSETTDFAADATAWERYLAGLLTRHHVKGAWRKHRESFEAPGVVSSRRAAAAEAVLRLYEAAATTRTLPQILLWLDAADPKPAPDPPTPPVRSRAGALT